MIDDIQTHGLRFSYHFSPAPNTSTSLVVGTTAGLLPIYKKYFIENKQYTEEKEAIYRDIYAAHIHPVNGLISLLETLHNEEIPMVIATSGIPVNISFMFDNIPVRHFFKAVINSTHITHGKPHPEIYEIAAKELEIPPSRCLAFEDSVSGVLSAKQAGFAVIALTTTHKAEELDQADLIVKDFTDVTLEIIYDLINPRIF